VANRTAVIETNKGTIKFELLEQDGTQLQHMDKIRDEVMRRPFQQIGKLTNDWPVVRFIGDANN